MEKITNILLLLNVILGIIIFLKQMNKRSVNEVKPNKFAELEKVKPGDFIFIESNRFKNKTEQIKCLNNDPKEQKILFEIHWLNFREMEGPEFEKFVVNYNSKELANFTLLNPQYKSTPQETTSEFDVSTLQKKLNEALENEEYEKADEYQKKIDELLKK